MDKLERCKERTMEEPVMVQRRYSGEASKYIVR